MWSVRRPGIGVDDTFVPCASSYQNVDLRNRLLDVAATVGDAEGQYNICGAESRLHEFAATDGLGLATSTELSRMYDEKMARKGGPARASYDQIKLLPKGDRCPMCDFRNVSTLDHFLPKTDYSNVTVTPLNLVGVCADCNKYKHSFSPTGPDDTLIHPYFDNIDDHCWLVADVVPTQPCSLRFRVNRVATWKDSLFSRVTRQFELLELGFLYGMESARELGNIRHNLGVHLVSGGVAAVQLELQRQWHSRREHRTNSWQTAMYAALANDVWFYSGGFSYI